MLHKGNMQHIKLPSRSAVAKKINTILQHPNFRFGLTIFISILGSIGAAELLKFLAPDTTFSANNLIIPIVCFLLFLFYRRPTALPRRERYYALICSVILAIILVIGGQLELYSNIAWRFTTIVKIISVGCLLYPVAALLLFSLSHLKEGKFIAQPRRHFLIAFACIFAVTFIVWLILFPGIYTYDMAAQNEIITKGGATGEWFIGQWSAGHWSLLYGFLFAGFLDLGKLIFGNYEAGMAIAMLVQAIFICYVETRIVMFATRSSRNFKVYVASILFFCLMPFVVVMAITSAQDTLFAGVFALVILNLIEITQNPAYFEKKINYFKIPLLGFVMCTIRSNGVYCLIFLLAFTLLFYKQPKRKLALLITVPIVAAFIYSGPFMKMLNLEKTTAIQEILSVPSQQLARVYYYTDLSAEDSASVDKFYDTQGEFSIYQKYPLIADHTKGSLITENVQGNLMDYVGLWLKLGLKDPDEYIEAFLLNSFGYWYPQKTYNDPRINLDYMNYPGFAMTGAFYDREAHPLMKSVERQSLHPGLAAKLDGLIFGHRWESIPIFATFCHMGFYMLLLLFVIGYVIAKRHYRLLMPLSLVFGLYLTLLLSPVAIFRYGYPIVMLAPMLTGLIFIANHKMPQPKAKRLRSK